jgi:hypothetical protein
MCATFDPYFGIAVQRGARKRAAIADVRFRLQRDGEWALANPDAYAQIYATTRAPMLLFFQYQQSARDVFATGRHVFLFHLPKSLGKSHAVNLFLFFFSRLAWVLGARHLRLARPMRLCL